MDKNVGISNSRTEKENVFLRSPLKENNILNSEVSKSNTNLVKTNELSDSSKLNCIIFLGNENSELAETLKSKRNILGLTTEQSSELKMRENSSSLKSLPNIILGKEIHNNKENTDNTDSKLPRVNDILPTSVSKRIMYNVSDMSSHIIIRKVHTDFSYFQELCRTGTIKNNSNVLPHEVLHSSPKKERNGFPTKLNKYAANTTIAKKRGITSNGYSNDNAEDHNVVNNTYFKSTESPDKHYQQSTENRKVASEESAKCDFYSLVAIKTNNPIKSDKAISLVYEDSNFVSQKELSTNLDNSTGQIEPLDLKVQIPKNDFATPKTLETIDKKPSTSKDILSLSSSITEKDSPNESNYELTQSADSDSPDVIPITPNDSKALFLETEEKSKQVLQQVPGNDLNKSSDKLSDCVNNPSILINTVNNPVNAELNIGLENKHSNLMEEKIVSADTPTISLKLNSNIPEPKIEAKVNQSDEKTLPNLEKSQTSSHDATPTANFSASARELCFDFLHFTAKWESYQQNLINKLSTNYLEMEELIKGTENICRRVEDISISTSQETTKIQKEFSQLQYYLGAATKLKLSAFFKNVTEMQKDFQTLHSSIEQYNIGVDHRLARILNAICEKNTCV